MNEYAEFRETIETEVWLIDRFYHDFASYYIGPDFGPVILPSTLPKNASKSLTEYAMKQNRLTMRRLAPWILAITFKAVDCIKKKTDKNRLPVAFVRFPNLKVVCDLLFNLLKDARNEIVHARKYRVQPVKYIEPMKKAYYEDFLVVRTKRNALWKIALPDLFGIAFLVTLLTDLVGNPRPSRRKITEVYEYIEFIKTVGYFREVDTQRLG